ncbi:MAG TPA: hypothetical protein VK196_03145, partial [Magnetospirillum sp.]|nr:hypothetical protein [Magnetospirillum sp.]
MLGRFDLVSCHNRERTLTAAKVLLAVALLAGCSSVPDAVNPVSWFKDDAQVGAPVQASSQGGDPAKTAADSRRDLANGLPADKNNSKYASPVRREVAP